MSAGAFQDVNYQYSDGTIGVIKIQPETSGTLQIGTASNVPVAGTRTGPRAFVSGSRRRQGLRFARLVRVAWTGAPPTGYDPAGVITLPLITNAIYAAAVQPGATGEYLGQAIRVVGVSPRPI